MDFSKIVDGSSVTSMKQKWGSGGGGALGDGVSHVPALLHHA